MKKVQSRKDFILKSVISVLGMLLNILELNNRLEHDKKDIYYWTKLFLIKVNVILPNN